MHTFELNIKEVCSIEDISVKVKKLLKSSKSISSSLNMKIKNMERIFNIFLVEHCNVSSELRNMFSELIDKTILFLEKKKSREEGQIYENYFTDKLVSIIFFAKNVQIDKEKNCCVVKGCEEIAINSHTISRANNFLHGSNYYGLKSRGENKNKGGLYLGRVLSTKASTKPIFCSYHDQVLFKEIEGDSNLDVTNKEHIYLQNWRTFLSNIQDNLDNIKKKQNLMFKNPIDVISNPLPLLKLTNNIDLKLFNEENKDIIYIAIEFKKCTPVLASFMQNIEVIMENKKQVAQNFYFHLLNNKNKHCLVISGFRTYNLINALKSLKELYMKDSFEFWQKIFNIMPMQKNVFFTEAFSLNKVLLEKLKDIELKNIKHGNLNFHNYSPVSFSKKEIFLLFGLSEMIDNIN